MQNTAVQTASQITPGGETAWNDAILSSGLRELVRIAVSTLSVFRSPGTSAPTKKPRRSALTGSIE